MLPFTDYTFYKENGGKLSESDYNASVGDANAEILSQTNGAALAAPDSMKLAVKLCECALVDLFAAYKETAHVLPKGIASISNDGYSVSKGTGGDASITVLERQERTAICSLYLQWPVNLMCRWI